MKKKLITLAFGIIILSFIIYSISPAKLLETLKDFNFSYLPLITLILIADYILSGINIWVLVLPLKNVPLLRIIKYIFLTLFFAVILPGKLADFLMIHFLKKDGITISQSTIIVISDKVISLIIKIIFGLIGAIFFLKQFNFLFIGIPLLTLLIIGIFLLVINSKKIRDLIKNKILKKYANIMKGFSKDLKNYKEKYKTYFLYNGIITIIKNFIESLQFYLLFLSFGVNVNILSIFFIFSLLSVIMLITFPIGISGLGARELIGIIIFSSIGIDAAIVFEIFMIRLALIYLINLITFTIYHDELNILKNSNIINRFRS